MEQTTKPCASCPWVEKGQPLIDAQVRAAAERGSWFCCHVNMGTCHGAAGYHQAQLRKPATVTQSTENNPVHE